MAGRKILSDGPGAMRVVKGHDQLFKVYTLYRAVQGRACLKIKLWLLVACVLYYLLT